jgi:hypothetical protein
MSLVASAHFTDGDTSGASKNSQVASGDVIVVGHIASKLTPQTLKMDHHRLVFENVVSHR